MFQAMHHARAQQLEGGGRGPFILVSSHSNYYYTAHSTHTHCGSRASFVFLIFPPHLFDCLVYRNPGLVRVPPQTPDGRRDGHIAHRQIIVARVQIAKVCFFYFLLRAVGFF